MGYALRALGPLAPALLVCAFALPAQAQLSLESAVQLAREQDPQTAAAIAAAEATAETAVADSQWGDPELKLGIANLPTDSFAFDDQPMTQKVIGIRQKLPRGASAALAGERGALAAEAGFAAAADMALALERDVGLAFLTLSEQLRVRELLMENRRWMQELVGYNRARLASAQIQSQQLLQSQLALARLDDRIAELDGEISRARGDLSRWIGNAAWQPLNPEPPAWRDTRDWLAAQTLPVPLAVVEPHPLIAASSAQVAAERVNVALAEEAYKPQFGVDVSYGQRERTPMSDGSDFASVMVTFDLPLFRHNRQDRRVAASRARESVGILQRQNLLQQMHAQLNGAVAMAQTLQRRRAEYQGELLAQAEATADAVLKGYASNTADLEAVIAARMDAIEAQISAARLTYGYFRAVARIRYFRAIESHASATRDNGK
ncbi:TolC family protein [Microbulbifer salipaludis]|uniref:TolC family protein n=1 Tax=Microbulbifer salipaludis TaxID=187980 RepID=A0ABS3E2U4_9GAMM|nr:TolC family protein [Microbulbifer salipaludis]MBN8429618.1 TolC family protein [Microbulbifer salipaludis]